MKLWIAALAACVLTTPALAATDAKKKNAMHHIASASASAEVCTTIETNPKLVAVAASAYGIDLAGPDGDDITADENQQVADLQKRSTESVCQAALYMYGPKGKYVKNLIREK